MPNESAHTRIREHVGTSVIDLHEMRTLYDEYERRSPRLHGAYRFATAESVLYYAPAIQRGWVTYTDVRSDAQANREIETAIEHYRMAGAHRFEWKYFDYDYPGLPARLHAHGFQIEPDEMVMVARSYDVIVSSNRAYADIRRADAGNLPAMLGAARSLFDALAYPTADMLIAMLEQEIRQTPDAISLFIAYTEETPAALAWIRYQPASPFAGLYGGSTHPAFRQRGLYSALVTARAIEAYGLGVAYLTIDAGPMSQPIIAKRGFQRLALSTPYMFTFTPAERH
jgi:hypothetical protein